MRVLRRTTVTLDAAGSLPGPMGSAVTEMIGVEERCPPGAVYTPAPTDYLILFLTLDGRAQVQVGAHSYTHEPGTLLMVAANSRLVERVGGSHWHSLYLLLQGEWADQMSAFLREHQEDGVLVCPHTPPHRHQLCTELLETALAQTGHWQWRLLARTAELLGQLYADALTATPEQQLMERIACLLDAEPQARPTLAHLAATVGLTPRQLTYQIYKATGKPPAQWMRQHRVGAARRLLEQGQSVCTVADALGFASPYHFSRVFKASEGVPPSVVSERARRVGLHFRCP